MQNTATPPASRFSGAQALTIFLSLSSVAVVVLALLGYGVALSAEVRFGIPHAVIFSSTSDLLTLGGWAVLHMLNYLGRLSEWELYVGLWERTWPVTRLALILAGAAFALGLAAFGVQHLAGRWQWLKIRTAQSRAFIAAHGSLARIAAFPVVMLTCIFLAVPLMAVVSLFGLTLLACFLSILPIAGLEAGTGHIDKWVIGPEICVPVRSRDTRLQVQPQQQTDESKKPKAATCVTVKKTGGEEHRGRVVFATFNAVVLYDPGAGSVWRVSTDGASVEVIDTVHASRDSSLSR
ncbi:hypothetical protein [Variovorax sp. DT-64]|uniref:hypothetical protein n=1 Tax=Variovorax sp. DT-64 TaxID=3396160 RepID=UPI003F1A7B66